MTANKLEGKARELVELLREFAALDVIWRNPDHDELRHRTDAAIVRTLDTARQSEGMVPHVWVLERVRDGAIRAVQREAPDDFDMTVAEDENNRYVRYVAAAPADAGEATQPERDGRG